MMIQFNQKALVGCGLFGVSFLVLGTLLCYKFIPDMVTKKIWEAKNLKNDTDQMEMFMKMPFPFDFKVYFFNIENPDEVLIGAKPKLKEIGPYIYNLYRWKTNVEWNSTSDEISYNGYERYEFDKDRSRPLSEEDVVTIINTPLNSFLMTAEEISPNALPTINDALPTIFGENSGIFLKTKVKDYLFDGIKICKDKGVTGGFASKLICSQIISKLNTTKAMTLWENSVLFANLRYKNNTSPGRETIHSGSNIKDETAELIRFKGNSYIKSWQENSKCNKIRGKTTVFPANIKTKFKFKSFSLDICRAVAMRYKNEETVKEIKGFKFASQNDSFWAINNTENHCFCLNTSKRLDGSVGCIDDGIMDLTSCTGGPVLLSFPHFLHADKKYLDTVHGLNPDENKHETFVILEPNSGTPIKTAKRVQFNMFLRPIEGITSIDNVTHSIIPIIWLEESMTLGDKYTNQIKDSLLKVLHYLGIMKWVVLIIGAISIIVPFFFLIYTK